MGTVKRFLVEGTWSGYTPAQCRVVHVEVVTNVIEKRIRHLRSIQFTDGTTLTITIRPFVNERRSAQRNQYGTLILEAAAKGTAHVRVADLIKKDEG